MPQSIVATWMQVVASASLMRHRPVQLCVSTALAVSILAIWFAPDTSPSLQDWFRILLLVAIGTIGMLTFIAARDEHAANADRQQRLIAAAVLVGIALLLNLTFGVGAAISFSIAYSLVAMVAIQDLGGRSPWLPCGLLVVVVPFWVWTALKAWHWGLLMLIPLASLAFVSDRHIRDAFSTPEPDTAGAGQLSSRGHRLGSWLGILGSALLILVTGILSNASNTWVALGAIGAVTAIALEAGLPRSQPQGARLSILLCDAAMAWIAFCWMISL